MFVPSKGGLPYRIDSKLNLQRLDCASEALARNTSLFCLGEGDEESDVL